MGAATGDGDLVPPEDELVLEDFLELDLSEPERKVHDLPPLEDFPEIPPEVAFEPLTARIVTTVTSNGREISVERLVTRSESRVHVDCSKSGQEWLFVRNPVDGRRTTAYLVDHEGELILTYQETDLRIEGVVRGWADVLSLGFRRDRFEAERTAKTASLAGIDFVLHEPTEPAGPSLLSEFWWSDTAFLVSRVVWSKGDATGVAELREASTEIEEERLRDPWHRFPGYEVMDVVDWREEHDSRRHGSLTPARPWIL